VHPGQDRCVRGVGTDLDICGGKALGSSLQFILLGGKASFDAVVETWVESTVVPLGQTSAEGVGCSGPHGKLHAVGRRQSTSRR
jgi:hypothetical protein